MDKIEGNSLKCRRRERRPHCRYRDRRAVRGELAELRSFAYALKEKGVECETRIIHGARTRLYCSTTAAIINSSRKLCRI